MKLYQLIILLLPSIVLGKPIGLERFTPPPYPEVPAHPQPEGPLYPPPQDYLYHGYRTDLAPAYTPPMSPDLSSFTACQIPAGTYRFDAYSIAKTEKLWLSELVLYLHISHAGIMVMRCRLKPRGGREEQYVVIPYSSNADLVNVCSGVNFSFFFKGINVYGKTLNGNLSGHLSRDGSKNNYHITADGWMERYDTSYNSRVTINLTGQQFDFVYPYIK
ncbi:hypothetical protein J7438_02665 [Thalassotalea sp. G20_0]|uniref:hypothetical protein n=1 Tax=Thalassotalea sp. G20_0 TaxID=2821093 RepID=UPI001ADB0467|nr:hypothetical protein [Thalassotalea sp. G20_0]MBO9492994.1 hypothetical protein [Thalassotalea sp. G20_0]